MRLSVSSFVNLSLRQGAVIFGTADDISERAASARPAQATEELNHLIERVDVLAADLPDSARYGVDVARRNASSVDRLLPVLASRSAPLLGDALRRFIMLGRYCDPDTALELTTSGAEVELALGRRARAGELPAAFANFSMGIVKTIVQGAQPDVRRAAKYLFAHPRPSDIGPWRQWFGRGIRFGSPYYALRLPRWALATPMTTADAVVSAVVMPEEIASDAAGELAEAIRHALDGVLATRTQLLTGVAERLGVSGRTLQRRLREVDLDFGGLVDEARKRRALGMIATRARPIKDIAQAVGFADARAFRSSFVRWTGATPREFRRRQGASTERAGDSQGAKERHPADDVATSRPVPGARRP